MVGYVLIKERQFVLLGYYYNVVLNIRKKIWKYLW